MKKVLLGFEHSALVKAITKYVRANDVEELEFQTVSSRQSVLNEIGTGEYDTVILMENIGKEVWSLDELIQIKDSYSINLIPIISEKYKGKKEMSIFCNYGITTAVFINQKNVYNVEEVSKMIYRPRILKDARVYYGITTIADIRGGGNVLDEVTYETVRNAIVYGNEEEPIGTRYINAIGELTPNQVGDFLKKLDEKTLNELKKTVEFYEVLEALKKARVIKSYHIPRNIKKLRNLRNQSTITQPEEDIVYEKEEVIADADSVKFIDESVYFEEQEEDMDFADDEDMEEDVLEDDALEETTDDDFGIVFGGDTLSDEDDFSFANEIEMIKEQHNDVEKKERENEMKEQLEEKEEKTTKKRKKLGELEETKEETEEASNNNKAVAIVALISILLVSFLAILIILFFNISAKRKAELAAAAASTPNEYNTLYNADDVARYEVGENGSVILQDENGNTLYEGNSSGIDNIPVEDEEIAFDVVSELQGESDTVNQAYNDTSAFENGKDYKGLDLVNMLNGNEGANCVLQMKNGSSVDIMRGNASIEEFKPSAFYSCSIDGSNLYFKEK